MKTLLKIAAATALTLPFFCQDATSATSPHSTPQKGAITMTATAEKMTTDAPVSREIVPGLTYTQTQEGTGAKPKAGDTVAVHYTGTLENGTKFDSSRDRGQPIEFRLGVGQVIQGWDKGIMELSVGERGVLTIAPDLGYGAHGAGGVIPGNATLIFDVELVSIK